jgi:RNA polymerase sigma factor (sigma-70 family)
MDLERALADLAPNLLRFCTGLTRDAAEGEELAQEALVALVRYWRAKGPPESPAAFAYTVARRQAARLTRRLMRLLPLELIESRPAPDLDPETLSSKRQKFRAALKALGALSVRDREALLLAMDEEVSVEGGAHVLGISPSAFKMRVHRARQRLAECLENEHELRGSEREAEAGS